MSINFQFFANLLLAYLTLVYLWSKIGNLPINEVERKIWSFLVKWWHDNTTSAPAPQRKQVPAAYAEQIYDAIKEHTSIPFEFTWWQNTTYSDFAVPCLSMDIVPKGCDSDDDLSILGVQALDRFRKCTVADNLLASRIITEKACGKIFLIILYASNESELKRYNQLLANEKAYADKVGLQSSAPIVDKALTEALNLFDSTVGDSYGSY